MCGRSVLSGQDVELAWGGVETLTGRSWHHVHVCCSDGPLAECWHVRFHDPSCGARVDLCQAA